MSAHGTPKTERLNVLISESIVEDIDRVAASKGISKSAFVRFAIENELERSQELELADAAETLAPLNRIELLEVTPRNLAQAHAVTVATIIAFTVCILFSA